MLDYMYAVFNSPAYRTRYFEFLKIDFPRLPLTTNVKLFRSLCELGARLISIHLMDEKGRDQPSFPIKGDGVVEKIVYSEPKKGHPGRVWINKTQYFEGVPLDVWNFRTGGFQPCDKWLKDRKSRALSYEDIQHYQRIVAAIGETIELMTKIDSAIEKNGGWPLK